jgi:hypothetical protein
MVLKTPNNAISGRDVERKTGERVMVQTINLTDHVWKLYHATENGEPSLLWCAVERYRLTIEHGRPRSKDWKPRDEHLLAIHLVIITFQAGPFEPTPHTPTGDV